ncbi:MAG TPA: TonB-dependent receptor, partial [Longimicrobiales bacterium]|nr:TonB-dependent receptor [Longimicrobiales bacterium]
MRWSRRAFEILTAVATLALLPWNARAQADPPRADTTRADTAAAVPLEGITVRALRAPAALGALPFSVTLRRPGDHAPSAGLSLGSELRAVPGLQVQGRHNEALGDRIVVRGFGARAQFGVRGVHVLVDGIPATMPDGQTTLNHLDLGRLDRAEVLRGPAAAAYGNAAGGVLLLETTPPPSGGIRHEATAAAGSDGLVRVRAATAGGTGSGGWTAAGTREWRDGFRPHGATERAQLTGRVAAPLAGGFLRLVAHGVAYDVDSPGALTLEQFRTDPHQAQAFNVVQGTGEEGRHGQVGATWEGAAPGGTLEATVHGLARAIANPIPPAFIDLDRRAGGVRLLLRGSEASPRGIGWAVGVDGAVQADDRQNYQNAEGERGELTLDQRERVGNVALHGQALIPLRARVGLFLGARYDRVTFSATDDFVTADNPDDSGRRAMDALSPTAGLRLDVSRDVSVFANVSTAFETPTTTELVNRPDGAGGFNQELEPQRTVSYEVGGRAALAPAVTLQASLYHARVEDALVPFEVASAPGRQYFRNAAGAVHRGVEALAEVRTARVDLLAAYSRTVAEFSSFTTPDGSFDGLAVPGVRPWTAAVDLVTRPHPGMIVELAYEATGDMAVDDANDARAPGYRLFDARLAAAPFRAGRWRARPFAGFDNLLDESYVASVVPNAFGGRFYEPGP